MNFSTIRRLITIAVLATASAPLFAQAGDPPRFPQPRITVEEWQTYFDEARAMPDAQILESAAPDQVIVQVLKRSLVIVFTAPTHPAYPAVVRRQVVADAKGDVRFARTGHFAGEEAAFSKWWKQFDELDRQSAERVQRQLREKKSQ
jgi:hypothetical protein